MNSIEERIPKWLDVIPGAIAGQGGHNQTFRVACSLYNGWGLSEAETLRWLKRYNTKCQPKWSEAELKHKAASAGKASHSKSRGHLAKTGSISPPLVALRRNSQASLPVSKQWPENAKSTVTSVTDAEKSPKCHSSHSTFAASKYTTFCTLHVHAYSAKQSNYCDNRDISHSAGSQSPHESDADPNRHGLWIAAQLKIFAIEGDIPQLEDGNPDTHAAAELAHWLELSREAYETRGIKAPDEEIRRTALACQFEHRGGMLPTMKAVRGFLSVRLTAMHDLPNQAEQDNADPDWHSSPL